MVLAVVRSHYGNDPKNIRDREMIYRASNAIAGWLGLASWMDIVVMQNAENVGDLRTILRQAK
jgi:hypothetical protein